MAWFFFVIVGLVILVVLEALLLVKKSNEIKKIVEFIKTGREIKTVPSAFVEAYKSRLEFIEQQFRKEMAELKSENELLREKIEKIEKLYSTRERELLDQLHPIFESIRELTEAFKMVIDEINSVLIENLENMNKRSSKIENDIKEGKEQVSDSVEDINELLNEMQNLSKNVINLSRHIESMRKVTQVVNDIVKEISFISLNAQIEANKMKESTAFRLLASEMRKLAENGKQSLKEVDKTISTVVSDINLNAEQINSFVNKVGQLKDKTNRITNEFGTIYQLVTSLIDYQMQLSEQIKQHFAGIQEIVGVLENIYNEGVQIVESRLQ